MLSARAGAKGQSIIYRNVRIGNPPKINQGKGERFVSFFSGVKNERERNGRGRAQGDTGSAICVYVCLCYFLSFLFTCSPVSAINSQSLQTCRDNGPGRLHGSPGGSESPTAVTLSVMEEQYPAAVLLRHGF